MPATITRRTALTGAAALAATPALSTAPMLGVDRPSHYRFKIGAFEVTTILDGAVQLPGPHPVFGGNATAEEVQALAKANLLPPDQLEIPFTVTLVNTGNELILLDTGNGEITERRPNAGNLLARLGDAGYSPDQIDHVAITHFHPDHIGGLMEGGKPAFPNAKYVMAAAEYDFWSPASQAESRVGKMVQANVVPFAEKTTFIKPGDSVVSGIEAVDTSGHTPGHLAYHIENNGARLMLTGDIANHYVIALQRPDWHVKFDMDKEAAVVARKKAFGMIAADKIPFVGYHMPAPAVGYVEAMGEGFRYIPASYQLNF
ncbi:MAG: MBL fold metallo-hydrolase [Pseudomonadota bacterium]